MGTRHIEKPQVKGSTLRVDTSYDKCGTTDQLLCGQQALLVRMLNALSGGTDLGTFLDQILADIAEQFAAPAAYSCLFCDEQDAFSLEAFYCRAGQPWNPVPLVAPQTARADPLWQELLRTHSSLLVSKAAQLPRIPFHRLFSARGLRNLGNLLLLPVGSGEELLGLLGVMGPDASTWEAKNVELAQILAQQTVLVLELAKVVHNVEYSAVLKEKNRMARDLHDTIANGLAGTLIQMSAAEQVLFQNQKEALRHIVRARQLLRHTLVEARHSVFGLRPQRLRKRCLARALQELAAEITFDTPVRAEFCLRGTVPSLPAEMDSQLFRIAQEALTNVLEHAHSSKAWIELSADSENLRLCIQDDGCGFNPRSAKVRQDFGLQGMHERARLIGGCLRVHSRPGSGSRIQVTIALRAECALVQSA